MRTALSDRAVQDGHPIQSVILESIPVNLPNSISLFRLALIPVFLGLIMAYEPGHEWIRYLAFLVFLTAALSDAVDGYIARHYDLKTKLGALLDPLADKLLTNLSFIFLAVTPHFDTDVPKWLPVVILSRDLSIAIGSYLMNKYRGPLRPKPRFSGKAATAGYSVGIAWVVLNWPYGYHVLMAVVALSVFSFIDYIFNGYERAVPNEETSE